MHDISMVSEVASNFLEPEVDLLETKGKVFYLNFYDEWT